MLSAHQVQSNINPHPKHKGGKGSFKVANTLANDLNSVKHIPNFWVKKKMCLQPKKKKLSLHAHTLANICRLGQYGFKLYLEVSESCFNISHIQHVDITILWSWFLVGFGWLDVDSLEN